VLAAGSAARTPCCLRGDAVIVNDMRKDAAAAVAAEIMEPRVSTAIGKSGWAAW
jgi:hypothetical protein